MLSAPRKYDQESRAGAVRMDRDRLAEPGESKLSARRHLGSLLDLNQATLQNWVEGRHGPDGTRTGSGRSTESDEIRSLKKRVAELERAQRPQDSTDAPQVLCHSYTGCGSWLSVA